LKQHGRMIVWLASVDSSKSRRQGRRLPRSSCLDMPKLAEVEDAARALSLESTSRSDAARPSRPWEKTGYIIVERRGKTRSFVLKSLAQVIRRSRDSKPKGKPS